MRPLRHLLELHGMASETEQLFVEAVGDRHRAAYADALRAIAAAIDAARLELLRTQGAEVARTGDEAKVVIDLPFQSAVLR